MTTRQAQSTQRKPQIPWWLGACLFGAIALFFLWEEHEVHILGAIPYLLLLVCPLIHLLMHGRHGHGGHHEHEPDERPHDEHLGRDQGHSHGGGR